MKAVILAGGIGSRMRPLTYVVPKAMLPVGGKPLLERTIQYLKSYGFREFVVCVAYLKRQIVDAFGDGSALGVKISYAEAETPMGTGGQLKTAQQFLDETFLAMNGDIVTSLDIHNLVDTHQKNGAIGTVAMKKFEVKIPYGYITLRDDSSIRNFEEKPILSFMANAGVYVLEPRIFRHIPERRVVSLETETFPTLIANGEKMNSYFEDAYWADVGSMSDFEKVNNELLSEAVSVVSRLE